jgi:hypothetical protein
MIWVKIARFDKYLKLIAPYPLKMGINISEYLNVRGAAGAPIKQS